MATRVLIVEDDAAIAGPLVRGLKARGYAPELVQTGDAASALPIERFDVAVVDLGLPDRSGLELLELWRGRTSVPLLVLTARNALEDRLAAFERGAADFLSKPFFIEELVARIEARLGHTTLRPSKLVRFGAAEVDLTARTVTLGGHLLELTAYEFNVLAFLVERQGRAVARFELAERVLREGTTDVRSVDSHVARVRRKLGAEGAAIKTVWGVGYAFRP